MDRLCGCVILILFFTPYFIFAQTSEKANNWFFGQEAGLNFQNGTAVPNTNGAMNGFEGTAVGSDENGQLLFYSNGGPGSPNNYFGGVWNSLHQLMPNGDLTNAGGCNSSLQSSLIINHPDNPDLHYLFTTDCMENNAIGGLRFSIIDMRLDGGLGDVAAKGIALTDSVDESLTAIRHANGKDYWIVAHKINTNLFHVYHLSSKGVSGVTTMAIGPVTGTYAGTLKASSDGKKLVYAGLDFTYLFRFNNLNGEISKPQDLGLNGGYTAEFSPNCQYLYVANSFDGELYQFNLIFPDPAISKTLVGTTAASGLGLMQLAPDGKIYIARMLSSSFLSVIEDPNEQGTDCNYQDLGFHLGGKQANAGLPNFPNDVVGECGNRDDAPNTSILSTVPPISVVNTNNNSMLLNWSTGATSAADQNYTLMYRSSTSDDWQEMNVVGNEVELMGLNPDTRYQIRITEDVKSPNSEHYSKLDGFLLKDLMDSEFENDKNYSETFASTLDLFDFDIYPNPARQNAKLSIKNTSASSDFSISIYTAAGKQVLDLKENINNSYKQINLNLNHLQNGIYQVIVNSNEISKSRKLVLMR